MDAATVVTLLGGLGLFLLGIQLCHALDHLAALNDDLTRVPPLGDWQPPAPRRRGR